MKKYPLLLQTKVSEAQKKIIQDNAALAGMSICAYLRARGIGHQVRSPIPARAINEITKIGNMVRWMVDDRRQGADEIMAALHDLRDRIESGEWAMENGDEDN